jgi:DNA uptake protein ComE-like DNA-binding protein
MDQAVMIARRQPIDWSALQDWARQEGMDDKVLEKLRRRAEKS